MNALNVEGTDSREGFSLCNTLLKNLKFYSIFKIICINKIIEIYGQPATPFQCFSNTYKNPRNYHMYSISKVFRVKTEQVHQNAASFYELMKRE